MVEKYNEAARTLGRSKQQMYAVRGDLLSLTAELTDPGLQGEEGFGFQVIVMSMALHHIETPQEILTRLVERLRDGGAVVIIDGVLEHEKLGQPPAADVTHDPTSPFDENWHHPVQHAVAHAGFTKDQLHGMLSEAGCNEVDFVLHPEPSKVPPAIGGQKQSFFARGRKGGHISQTA